MQLHPVHLPGYGPDLLSMLGNGWKHFAETWHMITDQGSLKYAFSISHEWGKYERALVRTQFMSTHVMNGLTDCAKIWCAPLGRSFSPSLPRSSTMMSGYRNMSPGILYIGSRRRYVCTSVLVTVASKLNPTGI